MKRLWLILIVLLVGQMIVSAQDSEDMQPVTLHFAAMVGDEMALCGMTYEGVGADNATISFNDFRLYVSNIHLLTADGDSVALELEQDGTWQFEDVALLDFEDGSESCSEIGNAALNGVVNGMAPAGDYVGLTFDLGVPFALNHLDVTTAASPLNIAALWWNWQGGYKFIRVDIMTHGEEDAPWNLHIGSTGCTSPASVIAPEEACSRPNIPTITLDEFDFENGVIVADLGGLLSDVPLYDNTPMPPGCMSGIDDPDCELLYPGFGLSLDEGVCPDDNCSAQTFFRISDMDSVSPVERTDMSGVMNMDMAGSEHNHSNHSASGGTIGEDSAVQIALERYPGTTTVEVKSGIAYGVAVWDIELSNGVSVEIDKANGEIVEISGAGEDWENPDYDDDRDDDDD